MSEAPASVNARLTSVENGLSSSWYWSAEKIAGHTYRRKKKPLRARTIDSHQPSAHHTSARTRRIVSNTVNV